MLNMLSRIRCVEIEINSFCNRKCSWCPNFRLKRNIPVEMPEKLYMKVLYELKDSGFSGTMSFSRYNEPMADIMLFKKRVEQARAVLPGVRLVSNTNGDFFSEENIKDLYLDELSIMDYDCIGPGKCIDRLNRANTRVERIDYPYIYARHENISILYFADWPVNALLVDRGGFLKPDIQKEAKDMKWLNDRIPRDRPCFEPMFFIGIDYTGDVTPCCQIRGDNPCHCRFIPGNIRDNTLSELYTSQTALLFRASVTQPEFSSCPYPCFYCQKNPGRYTRDNPGINFEEVF